MSLSVLCVGLWQALENVGYEQQWTNEYGSGDVDDNGHNIPLASEQYANAYGQQAVTQAQQLQIQSQPDEYYAVTPGENYYVDYSTSQPYTSHSADDDGVDGNDGNMMANTTSVVATPNAHEPFNQSVQAATIEQQIPDAVQMERQTRPNRVPNYLQSDTDDSQTGYIDPNNANSATYPDSDFEFSTNS